MGYIHKVNCSVWIHVCMTYARMHSCLDLILNKPADLHLTWTCLSGIGCVTTRFWLYPLNVLLDQKFLFKLYDSYFCFVYVLVKSINCLWHRGGGGGVYSDILVYTCINIGFKNYSINNFISFLQENITKQGSNLTPLNLPDLKKQKNKKKNLFTWKFTFWDP